MTEQSTMLLVRPDTNRPQTPVLGVLQSDADGHGRQNIRIYTGTYL